MSDSNPSFGFQNASRNASNVSDERSFQQDQQNYPRVNLPSNSNSRQNTNNHPINLQTLLIHNQLPPASNIINFQDTRFRSQLSNSQSPRQNNHIKKIEQTGVFHEVNENQLAGISSQKSCQNSWVKKRSISRKKMTKFGPGNQRQIIGEIIQVHSKQGPQNDRGQDQMTQKCEENSLVGNQVQVQEKNQVKDLIQVQNCNRTQNQTQSQDQDQSQILNQQFSYQQLPTELSPYDNLSNIHNQKIQYFLSQYDQYSHHLHPQMFQLPQIVPQMPQNITYEQLIQTHPWSLKNPKRIQLENQPINLQRIIYNRLMETHFLLLNQQKEFGMMNHMEGHQFNFPVQKRNGIDLSPLQPHERKSFKQLLEKRIEEPTYKKTVKIIFKQRSDSQEKREKVKIQKRMLMLKIDRKRSSSKKPSQPLNNSQPSCSQFSITHSKSTNDSSDFSTIISPSSSNSAITNNNLQKKYEKLNPQVSEFNISKYDKPFSKRYTINLNSYEESASKWWLYRIKNGIRRNYTGMVDFERFQSIEDTHQTLINDMMQKNDTVRQLFDGSRKTDKKIWLQSSTNKNHQHDADLTGLIVLPLRLQLPEGYTYSYDQYFRGCVYGLKIQNEFFRIQFYEGIQLSLKNESERDWRKKILLERNRVWFGDDLLRKFSQITFLKPTSEDVSIEGESERFEMIVNDVRNYEKRKSEKYNRYFRAPKVNVQVCKTVNWIVNPNYKKMSLRGKLEILAYCIAFVLFGAVFSYCFPPIKK